MKTFELTSKMSTIGGVFYPKGYAVLLFPGATQAQQAGEALEAAGFASDDVMLLPPATILHDIGKLEGDGGAGMPSVGTEGHTVDKYIALARRGEHGVMVHAPSDEDTERLLAALVDLPFTYGQKYHLLAMEDLVPATR